MEVRQAWRSMEVTGEDAKSVAASTAEGGINVVPLEADGRSELQGGSLRWRPAAARHYTRSLRRRGAGG
jgi:hypothetical protein